MNPRILNEGTITSRAKWLVVGLALLVETVLTIQVILDHLSDPVMQLIASIGVGMLAVSLLMLPRQLFNGDIKPGLHRTIAISVLVIELIVMTCNLIVALNTLSGWMDIYARFVLPATPAIVVAGQMLIWLSDPLDRVKIEEDQAQVTEQVLAARFRASIHAAKMKYAHEYLSSNEFQSQIAAWAREETQSTINQLSRASREVQAQQPLITSFLPGTEPGIKEPFVPGVISSSNEPNMKTVPEDDHAEPWTVERLLMTIGIPDQSQARALLERFELTDADTAYLKLRSYGKIPTDLSQSEFEPLFEQLLAPSEYTNGHAPNG